MFRCRNAWVKVFRIIPEFRFFDLARHRFCETCKSGEILRGGGGGGGGGGMALHWKDRRITVAIADNFPESLAVNPVIYNLIIDAGKSDIYFPIHFVNKLLPGLLLIHCEVFTAGFKQNCSRKFQRINCGVLNGWPRDTRKESLTWNGLLWHMWEDNQLQLEWEEGILSTHSGHQTQSQLEDCKIKPGKTFSYLSNWKKVVLWTRTFVNISHNTPPTLFPTLSCPSLLLARDSMGRGCKWIGLTPLGEPMPKFFSGVDLVFFLGGRGRERECFFFFFIGVGCR